ncbi:zinc finger protein 845-like [Oppia nitens]|uniref:zinc finger protein 845-like n=1 Tax=Oppia nitens TaxID=1686743 RepID=UPI0023DAE4F7|nr:zinc finger protein 845-like [Oppia nitens]
MCEIVVNDLFDEIINENNRLCNQLVFAMKCLDVLQTFETFIRKVMTFKTIIINEQQLSSQDIQTLDQLDNQLTDVLTQLKKKSAQSIKPYEKQLITGNVDQLSGKELIKNSGVNINKRLTVNPIRVKTFKLTTIDNNCSQQSHENDRQTQQMTDNLHEKQFPCFEINCDYKSCDISGLISHLKTCHSIIRFQCTHEECNQLFADQYFLNKHLQTKHNIFINKVNKQLEKKLNTMTEKSQENQIQVKQIPIECTNEGFKCCRCPHISNTLDNLVKHLKTKHSINCIKCMDKECNQLIVCYPNVQKHLCNKHKDNKGVNISKGKRKQSKMTTKAVTGDDVQQNRDVVEELHIRDVDQPIDWELQTLRPQLIKTTKTYSKVVKTIVKLPVMNNGSVDNNVLADNCHNQTPKVKKYNYENQFKCFRCFHSFGNINKFISHLKTQHSISLIKCTNKDCYRLLNDENELQKHLLTHIETVIQNEPQIPVSVPLVNKQTVDNQKRFKCYYIDCGQQFLSKVSLSQHLFSSHVRDDDDCNNIAVNVNNAITSDDITLPTNELSLSDQIMSKDEILVNTGVNLSVMDETMTSKPNSQPVYKPYKCDYEDCNYSAVYNASVARHREIHDRPHGNPRPYKCPHESCGIRFVTLQSMDLHLRQIHTTNRPFRCGYTGCTYRAADKLVLKRHMRYHTNPPKRPTTLLYCKWPGCKYKTIHAASLTTHRLVHSTERNWPCSWPGCDYRAKRKSDLESHTTTHTIIDNNVVCDWPECGKQFRTINAMRVHQIIHKGQLISCEWEGCRYKSIRKDKIKRHMNTVHLKLKRKS